MGYIKVLFSEVRNVIIDTVDSNQQTGQVIELENGLHSIALGGVADYSPLCQDVMVEKSGPLHPVEVRFEKS